MRFEVPQFIEIEDKIFGPLTWKQFVYMGGGVGVAVVLFFMTPFIIFVIVGLPVVAISFLLSFYPVNNRSFSVFLESFFNFSFNKKLYLWRKQGTGIYKGPDGNPVTTSVSASTTGYTPPPDTNNIHNLSRKLEMKALDTQNG